MRVISLAVFSAALAWCQITFPPARGTKPYVITTFTASPMTIPVGTHGHGTAAKMTCYSLSGSDYVPIASGGANCDWKKNAAGDIILNYATAPATAEIDGGGMRGQQGVQGERGVGGAIQYTAGSGLNIVGTVIAVAGDVARVQGGLLTGRPTCATSAPGDAALGEFYHQSDGTPTTYVCTATAWVTIMRSTDAVAATQLPSPGASSLGGTRSLTCSAGQHLSAIGTDGIPVCSADTGASFDPFDQAYEVISEGFFPARGTANTTHGTTMAWTINSSGTTAQIDDDQLSSLATCGDATGAHVGVACINVWSTSWGCMSANWGGYSPIRKVTEFKVGTEFRWIVRPATIDDGTLIRVGWAAGGAKDDDGIYIRFLHGTDTTWVGEKRASSSSTLTSSIGAIDASKWYILRMRISATNTVAVSAAEWGNAFGAEQTIDITGYTTALKPIIGAYRTSAARVLMIDRVTFKFATGL